MFENSSPVYAVIRRILNPLVVVMTLVVVCLLIGRPIDGYFVMLAVVSFFLSAQVYVEVVFGLFTIGIADMVRNYATGAIHLASRRALRALPPEPIWAGCTQSDYRRRHRAGR